ncbi:MAG: hypothetical protein HFE76_15315 [Firmicutes bacterium]|nr:hypothetical protein [Bacillota bacterium]
MNARNSKLIAAAFLLIIVVFGLGTVIKCVQQKEPLPESSNVRQMIEEAENCIQENFKSRNNWINVNGLFQRMLGTTVIRDAGGTTVYKLKNGQTIYGQEKRDVDYLVKNLRQLYSLAQKRDMDFLYVQLPFKIENDDMMPLGTEEFANDDANEIVRRLRQQGIPSMDIRKSIRKAGLKHDTLFFNTDQHWKPHAALWAAGLIAKKLKEDCGYSINEALFDIKNYKIETKENWFLGSFGKRTGMWYAGVDDFDIITPKFDTSYKFTARSKNGDRTKRKGPFRKALLKHAFLDKKDYFGINTYAGYAGGDYALNTVINHKAPNDKKILLVRDSFSCAMMPFLTMGAKEITAIDLRHYKEKSLADYIRQGDFGTVIVAYNPSAFTEVQFGFFEVIK